MRRVENWSDSLVDGLDGSLCGFAQPMLELGEELFDRVEIGRVFRQVEEPGAGGTDGASYSLALVRAEIDGVDAP